ncbi:MAG TPA: GTPase ObgE [Candidatus Limnocylindria bacterium]|jgi:GTP-binding protein|nr:GTPase ObgE [Candidatus Limnocylindria bacterium]
MFADQARILVAAGAGGDGSASFRREAHVPRGGPDGGDGGKGGDVVLEAEAGMTTLGELRRRRHLRAQPGGRGGRRRSHGRNGADVVVHVPPGTVVRLSEETAAGAPTARDLGELMAPGERLVVARGGKGGRGNVHFASPTHRAPTHYEKGQLGQERWIELELKLIADIGLVGAPNAGKSTLLAALTAARPEVGAFAFTTTSPNLGVLQLDEDGEVTAVIADLPGLIEGAHAGRGLGHAFLRHVERTRVLVAVVDGAAADPAAEWQAVEEELRLRDPAILQRPMPMVVTKMDLPAVRDRWPALRKALVAAGHQPLDVSAHDGGGLEALRDVLRRALAAVPPDKATASEPPVRVHRFDPLDEGWQVVGEDAALRVLGRRIETAAARTDFENEESRDRFQRLLERSGIDAELRRRGARAGTPVRIGAVELEWDDDE